MVVVSDDLTHFEVTKHIHDDIWREGGREGGRGEREREREKERVKHILKSRLGCYLTSRVVVF